jgi:aminoglycoside phosphotransferase (APT) family kinase protein
MKDNWIRTTPYVESSISQLTQLIQPALPGRRVESATIVAGGLCNTIYKIKVEGLTQPFVMRFYTGDSAACRKDVDLFNLLHRHVPIPEILFADPEAIHNPTPYALTAWIEGVTLRELIKAGNEAAIGAATYAVGAVRGIMSQFTFPTSGFFGPGLTIAQPLDMGSAGLCFYVRDALFQRGAAERLGTALSQRLSAFVEQYAPLIDEVATKAVLVHADFNPPNIIMSQTNASWTVAALLDWEFSFSAPALYDIGIFLRDSHGMPTLLESRFIEGFTEHGGVLPEEWHKIARLLDLFNLCDFLARSEIHETTMRDVAAVIRRTVED